ncbi:MAG: molybdopterin-dependent oxidoreductase [Acidobacteria bacterium]|nr:molybdopterin-dependent oxidoreductase [Acidobacteriota bacterium]
MALNRRAFLSTLGATGAAAVLEQWVDAQPLLPPRGGRLVRTMPLGRLDGRPKPPTGVLLGEGLDARLFTDLSALDVDRLVTPTSQFYVRTAHPPLLPPASEWRISLGGLVDKTGVLDRPTIEREAKDVGLRLMECAGNSDPANFGLLSAARWTGADLLALLDRVRPLANATRIKVVGIDDEQQASVTSNPGASWIFTREELERAGAFLAVGMNGAPLTLDHGAPVRLVVPNYYGCCCIKWVSSIDWVADDEPATLQMMEFSARTHQAGVPRLARDYTPPAIEVAATPVRVEQWAMGQGAGGRMLYRVVGIRWGGRRAEVPLTISFRGPDAFVPVSNNPPSPDPATWSLWSHEWTPDAPGRYQIALAVADRALPARRLDRAYYTRTVEIDRV